MGWVVNATTLLHYPRERDPVPIVQGAGWAPEPAGQVRKLSAPLGFDLRSVQPVGRHYIDNTLYEGYNK
jgi:hypothetical protein